MKAFIFSLDAFVAFTLALIAIYSLIFFSSVPSSYYYLMTQGHFLAKDVLFVLSTSECDPAVFGECYVGGSLLDNIVSDSTPNGRKQEIVTDIVGEMIPGQFGYAFEVSDDQGDSWNTVYDTRLAPGEEHRGRGQKIDVTSQMISFGYSSLEGMDDKSPYWYRSCGMNGTIITCSDSLNQDPSGVKPQIPGIDARLVRISIFV